MVATRRAPAENGDQPDGAGTEFRAQFDEPLERVLDLDTWSTGVDLDRLYSRLDHEIREALVQDSDHRAAIRERVFPKLAVRPGAAPEAGVYQMTPQQVRLVHQGLLFTGAVEAADGTVAVHETLPLSVAQIGVGLVSYQGDQGTWVHRLFRRDVRSRGGDDPVEEVLALLDRRHQRGALDREDADPLNSLTRRGLMTYAERAVLLHKSSALWRMGHGSPAPVELFTNAAEPFLDASLKTLRELLLDHRRFVFVPSTPSQRMWLTIGGALDPLEYAILETLEEQLESFVERGGHPAYPLEPMRKARAFVREVGPKLVLGIYRASRWAPGQLFYAHADHVHEAAMIAIADSVLHEHRGFPMLIDLADTICSANFSASAFANGVSAAYSAAGAPYRYLHERATRKG